MRFHCRIVFHPTKKKLYFDEQEEKRKSKNTKKLQNKYQII